MSTANLSPEARKSVEDAAARRKLYTARAELTVRLRCSFCDAEFYGEQGAGFQSTINRAADLGWRSHHNGKAWERKCPACAGK